MPAKKAAKKAPAKKQPVKNVVEAVATEATHSEAVMARLERINLRALEYMERTFEHGSEAERVALAAKLNGQILAQQAKAGGGDIDEARKRLREDFARLGAVFHD